MSQSQTLTETINSLKLPIEWAAQLTFRAYGVSVRVITTQAEMLPLIISYLPPGWKPTSGRPEVTYSLMERGTGRRQRYSLFCDEEAVIQSATLKQLVDGFESNLHQYIARTSPRRVFVHAGAVVWRGRAIIIPGRSFTGKTTLVAELVRAGAIFYSDEYAVLDERGRVHPFARPLGMRPKGGTSQRRVDPESIGAIIGGKPAPVGLILISTYRPNARWQPRQLSKGNGVLEVLSHTVPARTRPGSALAMIRQAVAHGEIIKTARGEARPTARLILDYLDRHCVGEAGLAPT
jgi:hypothetical protein